MHVLVKVDNLTIFKVLYHVSAHTLYSFKNLEKLISFSSLTSGGTQVYYSPNTTAGFPRLVMCDQSSTEPTLRFAYWQ